MPRPGVKTAVVQDAYRRLSELGGLHGWEDEIVEWLGCRPDSLRDHATRDGKCLSITAKARIRGKRQLTLTLTDR